MKTYLVTGAAGFIGANFIKYMLAKYDDIQIVVLDLLTYAGNLGTIASDIDRICWMLPAKLGQPAKIQPDIRHGAPTFVSIRFLPMKYMAA